MDTPHRQAHAIRRQRFGANMLVPPLNPPRLGDPLSSPHFAYVKRSSAERQARRWNEVLAADLGFGPTSGLVVGVAPVRDGDGRYALVWVRLEHGLRCLMRSSLAHNGLHRHSGAKSSAVWPTHASHNLILSVNFPRLAILPVMANHLFANQIQRRAVTPDCPASCGSLLAYAQLALPRFASDSLPHRWRRAGRVPRRHRHPADTR
jgi:hypothetical protein